MFHLNVVSRCGIVFLYLKRFIEDADLDLNQIDLSPGSQSGPGIFRDLFDSEFHKRYSEDEHLLKKNDPLTIMLEYNRFV